jgi:hypothetical protein
MDQHKCAGYFIFAFSNTKKNIYSKLVKLLSEMLNNSKDSKIWLHSLIAHMFTNCTHSNL